MEILQKLKNLNLVNKDFLTIASNQIRAIIEKGYYDISDKFLRFNNIKNLKDILENSREFYPIITEIKFASPSLGKINEESERQIEILKMMENGGASAISVLTQPLFFEGSLKNLEIVRKNTTLPVLMKDIIIDKKQIDAGFKLGVNVILLIETLYQKQSKKLDELIEYANNKGLEVLLEVNTIQELKCAIKRNVSIVGINNRNLNTLKLDMETTKNILSEKLDINKPIISESGIFKIEDIQKLGQSGIDGFLIGTSIMQSENIKDKVHELSTVKK
tara:strand:+ start:263 stop:1090 length:828 start_codon:yes stop_codon:yes gene_type:complete